MTGFAWWQATSCHLIPSSYKLFKIARQPSSRLSCKRCIKINASVLQILARKLNLFNHRSVTTEALGQIQETSFKFKITNKQKLTKSWFTVTPCLLSGCLLPKAPVGPHSQCRHDSENGFGIRFLVLAQNQPFAMVGRRDGLSQPAKLHLRPDVQV